MRERNEREGERVRERNVKISHELKTEFFSQERNTWKSELETADEFAQHFGGKKDICVLLLAFN